MPSQNGQMLLLLQQTSLSRVVCASPSFLPYSSLSMSLSLPLAFTLCLLPHLSISLSLLSFLSPLYLPYLSLALSIFYLGLSLRQFVPSAAYTTDNGRTRH